MILTIVICHWPQFHSVEVIVIVLTLINAICSLQYVYSIAQDFVNFVLPRLPVGTIVTVTAVTVMMEPDDVANGGIGSFAHGGGERAASSALAEGA